MRVGNLTLEQVGEHIWVGSLTGISVTIERSCGRWSGRIKSNAFDAYLLADCATAPEGVRALVEAELRTMLNVMRSVCEVEL